jgi:hypothetical protein
MSLQQVAASFRRPQRPERVFVRFVWAIVAFVVAAVLIGAGIGQRTIFAPPDKIDTQSSIRGDVAYTVIDGSILNAHPGQQTLYVDGGKDTFVSYGRTSDVLAWLGNEPYAKVSYNSKTDALTSKVIKDNKVQKYPDDAAARAEGATPAPTPTPTATPTPTPDPKSGGSGGSSEVAVTPGPNPRGSDLWLQQYVGTAAEKTKLAVPDSISILVARDGTKPAPSEVRLSWPLDTATPWAGPLIVAGLALLVVGLALYLWGLIHMRRSRGPRRTGGPKMPKLPKPPKYKPQAEIEAHPKGRRSARNAMIAVPLVLAGALALSGCSSDYWPSAASAKPTATPSALASVVPNSPKGTLPPAVTVPQLQRIVKSVSEAAAQGDKSMSATALQPRFSGPALQLREANYAIRAKDSSEQALPTIPAGPLALSLPQATTTWPRVVAAVVQNTAASKQAPIALVMVQADPRANYLVDYAMSLEPDAKIPDLAPATIGAAVVPPDSKLLMLPPDQLAQAYGDILLNGSDSKYYSKFDPAGDTLRTAVGQAYKAKLKSQVPSTATLTFADSDGPGAPLAMATNDSGAVVAVNLNETETLAVAQAGAVVSAGPAAGALAGLQSGSSKGIVSTYGYQLLFYDPPAGSNKKITLLGFSQGLVAASEVQ